MLAIQVLLMIRQSPYTAIKNTLSIPLTYMVSLSDMPLSTFLIMAPRRNVSSELFLPW